MGTNGASGGHDADTHSLCHCDDTTSNTNIKVWQKLKAKSKSCQCLQLSDLNGETNLTLKLLWDMKLQHFLIENS
jgi:hypothetical protein